MAPAELLGLLECPFQKGFVEFTYRPGDRVSELRVLIDKDWRVPGHLSRFLLNSQGGPWVFFCQDRIGAYLRLIDHDPIPTGTPEGDQESLPEPHHHLLSPLEEREPVIDMFFLGLRHRREDTDQELSNVRFKLRFTFDRSYEIPEGNKYSIRLIALAAIVGG